MPRTHAVLALTFLLAACSGPAVNPDPNHTHADFAVYIDGERFDFAQERYMSEAPRENEAGELVITEIPGRRYLHLHDMNGNVAHRHKPELTLGEFFASIGFTMADGCLTPDDGEAICAEEGKTWRMFVNGQETAFDPAYVWNDLDTILLTYGSDDAEIRHQLETLTDDACMYSKTCPERGNPPAENCIADPEVPCVAPLE